MYPPSFDYHRASSVGEALSLLEELPDATLLAGGHALIPHLKNGRAAPEAIVDVSDLSELTGVDVGPEATVIGAATTYADVLQTGTNANDSGGGTEGGILDEYAPAFAAATRAVGDRQIRNRGTVGGNLVEAHPDSDLPAAALVADASVRIRGRDSDRDVAVSEFLTGPFESAVGDTEIVTAVRVPHVDGTDAEGTVHSGGAYRKKTHPASGYAMVGVASRITVTDGVLSSARIAANGVADTVVRLSSVETALRGIDANAPDTAERVNEAAEEAAVAVPEAARRGDVHASAEYRVSILSTYVERAVRAALGNTTGAEGGEPDAGGRDQGGESR